MLSLLQLDPSTSLANPSTFLSPLNPAPALLPPVCESSNPRDVWEYGVDLEVLDIGGGREPDKAKYPVEGLE